MNYSDLEMRVAATTGQAVEALRDAVREEAKVLLELKVMQLGRKTAKVISAARSAAESYYADDIEAALNNPSPLRPEDVLCYRRKATAWAIAEMIRRAEKGGRR